MAKRQEFGGSDALQIIYYLMAADGYVSEPEELKFDAIAKDLNVSADDKKKVVEKCKAQISKVIDNDEYFDVIKEGVGDCLIDDGLYHSNLFWDKRVSNKVLVWDLLAVSFSDESYSKQERDLIKYIVRNISMDKSIFLEMENSMKAIYAVNGEIYWLKSNKDRPYQMVQCNLEELNKRKAVIEKSVKKLIED